MDKSIIIVGDFTTLLLIIDRSNRKNFSEDIEDFDTHYQFDLVHISRLLNNNKKPLFSNTC